MSGVTVRQCLEADTSLQGNTRALILLPRTLRRFLHIDSLKKVDVMPAYKDQIQEEVFRLNLMIIADNDDDDAGSNFAFQEPDKVLVSQAATMQGMELACWFHSALNEAKGTGLL